MICRNLEHDGEIARSAAVVAGWARYEALSDLHEDGARRTLERYQSV